MISEWKTEEWHFKVNDFNSVKCLYKTTSDWEMEIDYGKPYPEKFENDLTGVMHIVSWAKNVYIFKRPLGNYLLQTFVPR